MHPKWSIMDSVHCILKALFGDIANLGASKNGDELHILNLLSLFVVCESRDTRGHYVMGRVYIRNSVS